VTPSDYWPSSQKTPWQEYLDREHAARDGYLAVVERAHREYLIGPWVDRAAYEVVERQAWATYYAAGRDAWRTYRAAAEAPPPPPPPPAPQQPYYPPAQVETGLGFPGSAFPMFTPKPEGDQ